MAYLDGNVVLTIKKLQDVSYDLGRLSAILTALSESTSVVDTLKTAIDTGITGLKAYAG